MKNKILLILTLFTVINLSAQTYQGNKFINLSSSLNYTSQTVDFFGIKSSSSTFLFDSYVGYFVIDNLAVTASLTYLAYSGTGSASLSVGGRYYIQKFYAGCDLALDDISLRFNAGYPIFINDEIAIEPSISYSKVSESTSSLSMLVGFALYL
jgi:hypothetical protein|tara:strand:- start:760 stop:1218 length:459 start_codon:yes stop_codon:yes gene_type:complete